MANQLQTSKIILNEILMELATDLRVVRAMDTSYVSEFTKSAYAVGDTVQARRPQRFLYREGLEYKEQGIDNITVPITVSSAGGVDLGWDSIDPTLNDKGLKTKYVKPARMAISAAINQRAAAFIALNTANAAGTPGTIPSTIATYLAAGDRIIEQGMPMNDDLNCIITRNMSSIYVGGQQQFFNPAAMIGKQSETGRIYANQLGYTFSQDQTLLRQMTGAYGGAPTVNAAQSGAGAYTSGMPLVVQGALANATYVVGDRFTIGGGATAVNSVHPQTRQDNGRLQEYVITAPAVADGFGAVTLQVFPSITPSGQYQNVSQAAANGATINMIGAASTIHTQALLFHEQAFAFVSVPMAMPDQKGVEVAIMETDDETGLSVSFIRQFIATERRWVNRFDVLFGFARLNAELASVIYA